MGLLFIFWGNSFAVLCQDLSFSGERWGFVFVLYCLVLFKAPQLVPSRYQTETQTLGFLPWCRALSPQNYRMLISIMDIEIVSLSSSSTRVVERAKTWEVKQWTKQSCVRKRFAICKHYTYVRPWANTILFWDSASGISVKWA